MKLKKQQNFTSFFSIALIFAGIVGATFLTPKLVEFWDEIVTYKAKSPEYRLDAPSAVLPLALLNSEARKAQLEAIANGKEKSLDRARARYLLAADALREEYDGGKALSYLEGLEREYPLLAPYVLLRKGRAHELNNQTEKAQKIWQKLIESYPDSLVVAEALSKLGTYDESYWQEAISRFPQHPRTHEIAYRLLRKNPNQKHLLLLLAQYDRSHDSNQVRDYLIKTYGKELSPQEWQIVADGYWNHGLYSQAARGYQKAPANAQNLYRLGRASHLSDGTAAAKQNYQKLLSQFPDAEENALALRHLASLSDGEEALNYLDRAIAKFPQSAPQALMQKASLLSRLGRAEEARLARETILNKYPQSDETAEYRWALAKSFAKTGNLASAWQWAQPITTNNPDSNVAPKAAFWLGKWARQLGQEQEATKSFQFVLSNYPQSYYAWRSAVQLGLGVGDFTSIRQLQPAVKVPDNRPIPPAGSNMFKELFLLGEDRDAIALFAAEMSETQEFNVGEQFTQGLLEQIQGRNLKGINLIWSLKKKDNPEDVREWQILRNSPEYWHALFPFPFQEIIVDWSKERKLNPLLVTALIRQESRFEPEIKSPVGATGLMQVMPSTAEWIAPQIKLKEYSLSDPQDNVQLGTWYLDYTHRTYDNNSLLAVASYNAGPGNVAAWVEQYDLDDPDVFVENIPFAETKGYIETVFGNYWNYIRLYNPELAKEFS